MVKLQAIHIIEDDVYLIKRMQTYPRLQISGHMVETPGQFVVLNLDEVKVVIKPVPKVIHYVNKNTGEKLSLDEYDVNLRTLESKSDEDGIFSDIDEEYAYKKILQEWIPVNEEQPEYIFEPVEFEIIEVRKNSEDSDIVSLWNSENVIKNGKAYYSIKSLSVAKKFLTQLCSENKLQVEIPTHSGLTYAKINGDYVFDKSYDYKDDGYIGTLEECKQRKEDIYNRIKERVDFALLKKVKLLSVGEVLLNLENILHILNGSVSKTNHQQARASLIGLINKVRNQVE